MHCCSTIWTSPSLCSSGWSPLRSALSPSVSSGTTPFCEFTTQSRWWTPTELLCYSQFSVLFYCRAGKGGWSAKGCEVVFRNSTHISCQCYHMTSFAVLMDISRREVSCTTTVQFKSQPHINPWLLIRLFSLLCITCVRTERFSPSKSWRGVLWEWRWASSSSPLSSSSVWEPCSATRQALSTTEPRRSSSLSSSSSWASTRPTTR